MVKCGKCCGTWEREYRSLRNVSIATVVGGVAGVVLACVGVRAAARAYKRRKVTSLVRGGYSGRGHDRLVEISERTKISPAADDRGGRALWARGLRGANPRHRRGGATRIFRRRVSQVGIYPFQPSITSSAFCIFGSALLVVTALVTLCCCRQSPRGASAARAALELSSRADDQRGLVRGDGSRYRRGCHVDILSRRVAAPPRLPRG